VLEFNSNRTEPVRKNTNGLSDDVVRVFSYKRSYQNGGLSALREPRVILTESFAAYLFLVISSIPYSAFEHGG